MPLLLGVIVIHPREPKGPPPMLADRIIEAQRKEIGEMKALINDLEANR